jgi:hypothetical protein
MASNVASPRIPREQAKKPAIGNRPNEDRMWDIEQDLNLAEKSFRKARGEKNFLFAEEFRDAQLAFQHHIESVGRVAVPNEGLSLHKTDLSSRRHLRWESSS